MIGVNVDETGFPQAAGQLCHEERIVGHPIISQRDLALTVEDEHDLDWYKSELATYHELVSDLQGFVIDLFYSSYITIDKESSDSINQLKK